MTGRVIDGFVGGLAGTAALSATMAAGKAAGHVPLSAPHEISWRLARATGLPQRPLWLFGHFGYGAACGAIYGALRPLLPRSPLLAGVAFGLGVWGLSYLALMPRLGLYPKARWDLPARRRVVLAGHALYGLVLGAIEARRG